MLHRILGGFNLLVAVAVAVNFVATPLYYQGGEYEVWRILNWFMTVAILISLVESGAALRAAKTCCDGATCVSSCSCECLLFCASVIVGLLYFNSWLIGLMTPEPPEGIWLLQWNLIDAVFPVLVGTTGVRLWRRGAA